MKQNFIFASCFLWSHFSFATKIKSECLARTAVPTRKAVLGKTCLTWDADWLAACHDRASCFCHARVIKLSILQLMQPLPMTRLGSPWLGAHVLAPQVCSRSNQGQKPNSAVSSTWGSSKMNFHRQWLACSNTLARLWGSLGGLLPAAQNWPISYQVPRGLVDLVSLLVGVFLCLERKLVGSCWAL